MPTAQQHLDQYNHNKQFLGEDLLDCDNTPYLDWILTIAFYAAIHLFEKHLADKNMHSGNHDQRLDNINKYTVLKQLKKPYSELKRASENARYKCHEYSPDDVKKFLRHELLQIKNTLNPTR